ncbi:Beta-barrel assembly machine subunit BamD [Persephonella hydrogeniphila]|uniref:Beta-barrel assembly machine subunit BamD n=1 Tax=Persephonella hydrogeniphila TaxID=198703 RepID=A0A285MZN4_9AQUI|nr:outer membrane protein assembly factor BamD [Persephonella hydrogeniphila]SNZ02664.1 Beta-barrel assembly machine subunit BamD [Persephonella hydrogeniphila]
MKKIVVAFVSAGLLFSCAEKVVKKEQVLTEAYRLYEKGEYDDAKEYFKKAIYEAQNMTTTDIMKARYHLANIYYLEENYIDAIVEFEEFLSLFPTAPQVPEVLYKLADSYLKVSPSPDRDLTYVRKAMEKAEELVDNYPESIYVEKAKKIIQKCRKIEATHLIEIADLYEHLGKHYSAAVYYNLVYDDFSDQIQKDFIEYKIAYNLANAERQYKDEIEEYTEKIKNLEKKIKEEKDVEKKNVLINRKKLLKEHIDKLKNRIRKSKERAVAILKHALDSYPDSKYRKDMENLLKNLEKEG